MRDIKTTEGSRWRAAEGCSFLVGVTSPLHPLCDLLLWKVPLGSVPDSQRTVLGALPLPSRHDPTVPPRIPNFKH
jgi:hypothetical protein